jgi:hypothetical protein
MEVMATVGWRMRCGRGKGLQQQRTQQLTRGQTEVKAIVAWVVAQQWGRVRQVGVVMVELVQLELQQGESCWSATLGWH